MKLNERDMKFISMLVLEHISDKELTYLHICNTLEKVEQQNYIDIEGITEMVQIDFKDGHIEKVFLFPISPEPVASIEMKDVLYDMKEDIIGADRLEKLDKLEEFKKNWEKEGN